MGWWNEKTPLIKISDTLQGRFINAELSLQSASHNSREIIQRQSGSQIRELWAMFVIRCYCVRYNKLISFLSYFYHSFAIEALR